jgi:uncharacterized protein
MAHRPATPFHLTVSDLLQDTGRRRSAEIEAPADWSLELSRIDPSVPLRAGVTLESVAGGLVLRGRISVRARHTCNRCTTEWSEDVDVTTTELLGVEADDDYPLDGDVADLEPPLRDAVLLALPLVPLCRPDCAGLCSVCGADLNTGSCPGHEEDADSPFAALRGLLEP